MLAKKTNCFFPSPFVTLKLRIFHPEEKDAATKIRLNQTTHLTLATHGMVSSLAKRLVHGRLHLTNSLQEWRYTCESWLFNRDPGVMVYEISPIYLGRISSPTNPNQPGFFHCSHVLRVTHSNMCTV